MIKIPLTQGYTALIDSEDEARVRKHKWHASIRPRKSGPPRVYATAKIGGKNIYLHRYLLPDVDRALDIDHINNDATDNRRANLRVVSRQRNALNRHPATATSPSKTLGVLLKGGGWEARLGPHYIGRFKTFDEAKAARRGALVAWEIASSTPSAEATPPRRPVFRPAI